MAWIWNAMVPRLEMATTLMKLDTNVTTVTVVPASAVLLKQVTLKASKTLEDSVTSITLVATMASMASMVASMVSMASTEMVASMESKEAPMASFGSVAPMARMALASLDLVASMVWVKDLNRRILCNVMLKFPPLKTWICSLTKLAWDAEGSRSSRRVDVVKVKKELMGSQIWSVVVTWAMVASMASMVASMTSMASMASTELMVASMASMDAPMASFGSVAPTTLMALASRFWVSDLSWRKLSNEMLTHGKLTELFDETDLG